jgi:hypothetical protein
VILGRQPSWYVVTGCVAALYITPFIVAFWPCDGAPMTGTEEAPRKPSPTPEKIAEKALPPTTPDEFEDDDPPFIPRIMEAREYGESLQLESLQQERREMMRQMRKRK